MASDSKDPGPSSKNSARSGGGNEPYPAGAEKHGDGRAERVPASARYSLRKGDKQPGRKGGDGNVPVGSDNESHGQAKAERIPASRRF